MIPIHKKLYADLNLTIQDIATVVDGGLFNNVHRVTRLDEHFYIKSFTNEAKTQGFPPLPTSASQRYNVAVQLHEHAQKVVTDHVYVPKLLTSDSDNNAIAMEGAKGKNLYDYVVNDETFSFAVEQASHVLSWLGSLHKLKYTNTISMNFNSKDFKKYKATLQYKNMFEFLPRKNRENASLFLDEHISLRDTLLHGDLNTRNIIICEDGRIAVIDFEQGQMGCGSHDAAYLISELVIASFVVNEDTDALIDELWLSYEAIPTHPDKHMRFRRHLCFQVIYRLKGPSRNIWTEHLTESGVAANSTADYEKAVKFISYFLHNLLLSIWTFEKLPFSIPRKFWIIVWHGRHYSWLYFYNQNSCQPYTYLYIGPHKYNVFIQDIVFNSSSNQCSRLIC
jgi:tRNA A-37 threonylcarbamoyl transferase component Bud32